MHYIRHLFLRHLVIKWATNTLAHIVLTVMMSALMILSGCGVRPAMTFEQDRLMTTEAEQKFFQQPLAVQPSSARLQPNSILRADDTEEAAYLRNIIQLLEQAKISAAHAQKQAQPQQRKVFNYDALEIDIDTVIFAIKRYLAADDYTPRGFDALPPTQLNARYLDVK